MTSAILAADFDRGIGGGDVSFLRVVSAVQRKC